MIYVKLNIDNTIEYAKNIYTTDEGELILNFKANPELMKQYGFKELIDSPVDFDTNYQTLQCLILKMQIALPNSIVLLISQSRL